MSKPVSGSGHEGEILGLGMSTLDLLQVVDAFPAEGGVSASHESLLMGGGPVPTALCAAARLGAPAAIIDRIGSDWRGTLVEEDYTRHGVALAGLQRQANATTTLAVILVRRSDGERHIVYTPGTFTPFSQDELPEERLRRAAFLHLNGRHWPACITAARLVREGGGVTSFDGGAHRWRDELRDILPLVDILIVSRDFATRMSGATSIGTQLESLSRWNAALAGITGGEEGSWFRTREGEEFHQPAFPADPVVDTTGCGDVFHGVFLAARSRGHDWQGCARFASLAASQNASALGGRGKLVDAGQLERLAGSPW